jgi:hypothetical protein
MAGTPWEPETLAAGAEIVAVARDLNRFRLCRSRGAEMNAR